MTRESSKRWSRTLAGGFEPREGSITVPTPSSDAASWYFGPPGVCTKIVPRGTSTPATRSISAVVT